MSRVRNALAMLACTAMFGCTIHNPASTPTLEQVNLSFQTTYIAKALGDDLSHSFVEQYPEFSISVRSQSYSNIMTTLDDGTVDYVISSYVPLREDIWVAPLAQDGLVLIVHPENMVTNLDTETIRDIYSGQVKDWEDISDKTGTLIPLTYSESHDSYHEFHRLIMGRQGITGNAQLVPSTQTMISRVSTTPTAIGYIPLSQLTPDVKPLTINGIAVTEKTMRDNIYPLRTTLFVIGRDEPSPPYRTFLSWVQSQEGQAIVDQQYVPLP